MALFDQVVANGQVRPELVVQVMEFEYLEVGNGGAHVTRGDCADGTADVMR